MSSSESLPLLGIRALRVCYGLQQVLHGIDLTVGPGEVVALLGANGAGKTTLLRAVSGLLPYGGHITSEGSEPSRRGSAAVVAAGIVQVPEHRGTFADLSVAENLELGAYSRRLKRRELTAHINDLYDMFPVLANRRQQQAGTLSGGEQQMLAIARALMAKPRLLLLDEPSLGLAPSVTQRVFATLSRLHADTGLSVLLVEQNAELSLSIAHRAYVMEAGVIKIEGPAEVIRSDDALRRAYLGS
ncbi:ABC transporter ATP-binding protein [Streptomyces malaysiensis]|uniref:ABC transporter ATP-binding protein n=1 Tax=Streptomyces malaysiensis TaxID=92644 RepID=UPI002B2FD1FC|nr:ABC transporter ATP-binding protein [Streptomyces malaysiensis]